MHKRTMLHALAVISCLTWTLAAGAQEPAPRPEDMPAATSNEAIKVATHASRWDYPKEIAAPPGHQIHIVEKGDTLWDLGAKYLGNPFAWPQIWELNKWVKDPHWIYPGDPLVVDRSRSSVPTGKEQEGAPYEVSTLRPDLKRIPKPVPEEYAYTFQDFIQLPFLYAAGAPAYFKTKGAFLLHGHQDRTRGILSDGDTVYLNGGSDQGVKAGDRLVITKVVTRSFYHPSDTTHRKVLGDVLQQEGIVRVTTTYPGSSVAMIEHALDGLYEGSYGVPFQEPATLVANQRKDVASPVPLKEPLAHIIFLRENRPVAAAGDMVLIDQGTKQGLKQGDVLLLARRRQIDTGLQSGDVREDPSKPSTNYDLGQMVVVATEETSSTCRILRSKEELVVGDIVTR